MIARVLDKIFLIKGIYSIYLIVREGEGILIDSSNGEDTNILVEGIEEIITQYDVQVHYLILTSHHEDVAGGAGKISSILGVQYIVASNEDAVLIRKGEGKEKNYSPTRINLEIKDKISQLSELKIFKTKAPTKGSLAILYNGILFTGVNRVSGIMGKINYICNAYECKKVEEPWFLRKDAIYVEDLQKQNTAV